MDMPKPQKSPRRRPLTEAERAESQRLFKIWEAKKGNLTQEDAATQFGITQGAIHQYLRGKTRLNDQIILKFAELLRFDPREVRPSISALPPWMRFSSPDAKADNFVSADTSRRVPLISWVQAGEWTTVEDPYPPGTGDSWISCYSDVGPHAFALRVRGDSMTRPFGEPSFPEGTVIIVDPDAEARSGRFVIAKLEGDEEATFKQLIVEGGRTQLVALNPSWPAIIVDRPMVICGVVVAIAQRNLI